MKRLKLLAVNSKAAPIHFVFLIGPQQPVHLYFRLPEKNEVLIFFLCNNSQSSASQCLHNIYLHLLWIAHIPLFIIRIGWQLTSSDMYRQLFDQIGLCIKRVKVYIIIQSVVQPLVINSRKCELHNSMPWVWDMKWNLLVLFVM